MPQIFKIGKYVIYFWWNYVLLLSKIRIYKNGYLKNFALYCHTDLLRANALRGGNIENFDKW
jgi:hypothetical protein